MPPNTAHTDMSVRASTSVPSAYARRSPVPARRNPSRASPSVSGLARTDTSGSRHWVSASSPLDAVTAGGHGTVSRGSTSATAGSISGLRRLAFTASAVEVSTAFAVTSEPVPAVVGTATYGTGRCAIGTPRPTASM